jgi:hypothetical protein
MISQRDFDPGDYHLRVLIEQMERDGRSEHAIDAAVRAASDESPVAERSAIAHDAPRDGAMRRLLERTH